MQSLKHTRREFIKSSAGIALGTLAGASMGITGCIFKPEKPVVSVVKINKDNIDFAVEKAMDLLGGIKTITRHKDRIMLKPNLVANSPNFTTKPTVIRALTRLMKKAGKELCIGEGSAAANGFNVKDNVLYHTRKQEILDPMQQYVFDVLGYTELAKSENIQLINLHSGDLMELKVPKSLAFDSITLHKSLTDIDLLCSVPMMKTHSLATVTLGMKNLIGLYPGKIYCSVRSCLHDQAASAGSPGIAYEILDMVRANKLGLVVIDGSMAMEGNGPTDGTVLKMDLIIAGTNPLATDMVAANIMGFEPDEVPTFNTAFTIGMKPNTISDIEIRGERIADVKRKFVRPNVVPWTSISQFWGTQEL